MSGALTQNPGNAAVITALAAVDKLGTALKAAVSQAQLVQSNILTDASGFDSFSIHALEQQARAMRAECIARTFRGWLAAIDNWFERRRQQELDDYLAASQNLADLEVRMRRFTEKVPQFDAMHAQYD
jgi:hypothetical protein